MTGRLLILLLGTILMLATPVSAEEPNPPQPGPLPPRKSAAPLPVDLQLRSDRYAVWQFYDIDRFGRFRPLVVAGPHGGYYLATGMPFPWVSTHPLEVIRKRVE